MRLQKHLSRKIGKKEYVKWVITIPSDEIKKLGWKAGDDLKLETDSNILVIEPKIKRNNSKNTNKQPK